ncbi:MAG: hypothetical protein ACKV2U_31085 [Bryobacteraceae bacterium]
MPPFCTRGPAAVHLHWVRQTFGHDLILPVSRTIEDFGELPGAVQRYLEELPVGEVELHLPPYFTLGSVRRTTPIEEWAAGLRFRRDFAGRIVASHVADPEPAATHALHQAIVLITRTAFADATPLTIAAEPEPGGILPDPKPVSRVCDPGLGLTGAPAEATHDYARIYRQLAKRLQAGMRQWIPAQYLRSVEDFAVPQKAVAALAYSVAEPVNGGYVDEMGLSVLNFELLARAFVPVAKRIDVPLRAATAALAAVPGAEPVVAALCHRNATRMTAEVIRQRTHLLRLVHNEYAVITGFIQFCSRVEEWSEALRTGTALNRGILREIRTEFGGILDVLAAFYQRRQQFPVASLLLVEAVRVLEPQVVEEVPRAA